MAVRTAIIQISGNNNHFVNFDPLFFFHSPADERQTACVSRKGVARTHVTSLRSMASISKCHPSTHDEPHTDVGIAFPSAVLFIIIAVCSVLLYCIISNVHWMQAEPAQWAFGTKCERDVGRPKHCSVMRNVCHTFACYDTCCVAMCISDVNPVTLLALRWCICGGDQTLRREGRRER